jgi:hypothetical protein
MIERSWHIIAGLSNNGVPVLLAAREFCSTLFSFDIAKFICMVTVAHAHCEVASASKMALYASVGRKYRRL